LDADEISSSDLAGKASDTAAYAAERSDLRCGYRCYRGVEDNNQRHFCLAQIG
jgi:hypothetical protein